MASMIVAEPFGTVINLIGEILGARNSDSGKLPVATSHYRPSRDVASAKNRQARTTVNKSTSRHLLLQPSVSWSARTDGGTLKSTGQLCAPQQSLARNSAQQTNTDADN